MDVDTDAGLLLVGKVDGFVASALSLGGQVLLAFPDDVSLTNVGATIKGHFGSENFQVSPGVALSYQIIRLDDVSDSIAGFSPGAFVELKIPLSNRVLGAGEVGFISQPSGGNSDVEVTFGPIFYIAIGAEFELGG